MRLRARLKLSTFDADAAGTGLAVGVSYNERSKTAIAVGIPMLSNGAPQFEQTKFIAEEPSDFPYRAGLFVYREGPAVVALVNSLPASIPFLVIYSQGIAHPRGFGLASHIGVLGGIPSIGLTRKRLWGFAKTPPLESTTAIELRDKSGKAIGLTKRMLPACEPIFASPGHLTNLQTVRSFLAGVTAIKGCFPEALSLAQEEANHRSFNS